MGPVLWKLGLGLGDDARFAVVQCEARGLRALVKRAYALHMRC